jgi:hypothetical protein
MTCDYCNEPCEMVRGRLFDVGSGPHWCSQRDYAYSAVTRLRTRAARRQESVERKPDWLVHVCDSRCYDVVQERGDPSTAVPQRSAGNGVESGAGSSPAPEPSRTALRGVEDVDVA